MIGKGGRTIAFTPTSAEMTNADFTVNEPDLKNILPYLFPESGSDISQVNELIASISKPIKSPPFGGPGVSGFAEIQCGRAMSNLTSSRNHTPIATSVPGHDRAAHMAAWRVAQVDKLFQRVGRVI